MAFSRALYFDEGAAVIHDDVHIGLGLRVFGVVEIERGGAPRQMPTDMAATLPVQRACGDRAPAARSRLAGLREGDISAEPVIAAVRVPPSVPLQHIAIEGDGAAHRAPSVIHHRPQCPCPMRR